MSAKRRPSFSSLWLVSVMCVPVGFSVLFGMSGWAGKLVLVFLLSLTMLAGEAGLASFFGNRLPPIALFAGPVAVILVGGTVLALCSLFVHRRRA